MPKQSWAPAEIFAGGMGKPKKGPPHGEKCSREGPHMMKRAPHEVKNIAKMPPHGENTALFSYSEKFGGLFSKWASAYPPPLPCGAHASSVP